ncbi:hypothetical protein [Streptomyces sp. NPDC001744]|uniref:hypothetical protein n=1 Tax=Streptomyces sp. NPDC001744 TaxID=3364606 RepID=UPI0036B75A6B
MTGVVTVLIVDGALVLVRWHIVAEWVKSYRYCVHHQVVIGAGLRPVVVVGRPLMRNHDGCEA